MTLNERSVIKDTTFNDKASSMPFNMSRPKWPWMTLKDKTETEQNGEDDDGNGDVVATDVTAEFYIRHQVPHHSAVFFRRYLQQNSTPG